MNDFAADSRTRSYVLSKQKRFGSTSTTESSFVNGTPARIFEHYRGDPAAAVEDSPGRKSSGWLPSSFREIETWLQSQADEAIQAAAAGISKDDNDERSAIKIVFLNERQCEKAWKNEGCNIVTKLHPKLRMEDWTTAHYMTTYYKFPVPLHVDENSGHSWNYRYSVSHPFDWDLVWCYFPPTRTTIGILRTWFEDYSAGFQEMEETIERFAGPTLAHPMLLGLFSLQLLTSDTMANVREKGNRLYEAQCATGFQMYPHLRTTELDDDASSSVLKQEALNLSIVTKEVLGATSNLTGWENAAGQMIGFARFLATESTQFADSDHVPGTRTFRNLCAYIDQQTQKQVSDLEGARCDTRAWLATASFVLQGVLNMISQRDAGMNIKLAKNSNKIALEAKRDSTSMMAIAVVTMFFLPGTFMSVSRCPDLIPSEYRGEEDGD
jgi:hypothetical protein